MKEFLIAKDRAQQHSARYERRMESIIQRDIPSFMELPIINTEEQMKEKDIIFLGVPYEGVKIKDPLTFIPPIATPIDEKELKIYSRSGAYEAPEAVRRNSIYYSINHCDGFFPEMEKDFILMNEIKTGDYGDIEINIKQDTQKTMDQITEVYETIYGNGAIPMTMGGDHLVPFPIIHGLSKVSNDNIGIIVFDSHLDMSWEPKYWAGSQWARIFELGIVKPKNFVQIGIRGFRQSYQWKYAAEELGYTYFTMTDVEELGIKEVTRRAVEIASDGTSGIYTSLDYDVLEPGLAPAQKFPDPNGLTSREIITALKMISKNKVLGFDICCMSPKYDYNGLGSQLAARCIVEVMGGIGLRKKHQRLQAGPVQE